MTDTQDKRSFIVATRPDGVRLLLGFCYFYACKEHRFSWLEMDLTEPGIYAGEGDDLEIVRELCRFQLPKGWKVRTVPVAKIEKETGDLFGKPIKQKNTGGKMSRYRRFFQHCPNPPMAGSRDDD